MEILPPDAPNNTDKTATTPFAETAGSSIFYGPNGLRASWSVLLYIGVLESLLFLAAFELRWFTVHLHQPIGVGQFHPTIAIVAEATTLLAVVLATALMAGLERRRASFYGLIGAERLRQFLIGIVSGFIFLSLLVGILVATHHLKLGRAHAPWGHSLAYAAAWGLCFFLAAMKEELMFRGYPFFTLARGVRFWPAAIVLAILFGWQHSGNPGESPFGLVVAALIALVFSLSLWRLGHLWWAIGFHMAWDWAESFFYGTADSGLVSAGRLMHAHPLGNLLLSGGATGPEGSAWCLPIVLLVALFVWTTQPHRGIRLVKNAGLTVSPGIQSSQR